MLESAAASRSNIDLSCFSRQPGCLIAFIPIGLQSIAEMLERTQVQIC